GHLAGQRALQVYHLIVGKRQNEIFAVGIHLAEGQLVMVKRSIDRVLAEVVEGIVHPAHVPLHGKAQRSEARRVGKWRTSTSTRSKRDCSSDVCSSDLRASCRTASPSGVPPHRGKTAK